MESWSCPECVPVGLPGLWTAITPHSNLGSGWGLNQYFSPCQDLSNNVSHFPSTRRERVDSRLLVVGSQTVSLTPGPSFAHNLGCICPNDQCEAIFDIDASRPFQWHQEHPNARCFGPCYWTLNIQESRRTLSPQLLGVLGFTPTLGQSGVATLLIWFWTSKSRELLLFTCMQVACHKLLESFWWGLQLFFKPHLDRKFA
jgi:hypothetical protein